MKDRPACPGAVRAFAGMTSQSVRCGPPVISGFQQCKSVETDEQAALDNGAKRQAEQVRHRRPAARSAAKIFVASHPPY